METSKWREYIENKEIAEIEKNIKNLQDALISMRKSVTDSWRAYDKLNEEKWRDEELQEMKKKMEQAIRERNYGFPLTKEEHDKAYDWQLKHDTEVHSNPSGYHGASGGGFTYVFYPTGLGTTCDCFCNACKAKAIREAGEKWYDKCKELGGVFEVIGWEGF